LKLDRQIGSFPIEYKAEGASPALIEAEVVGFHREEL